MNFSHIRVSSLEARIDGGAPLLALLDRLHASIERTQALERSIEAIAEDGELVFRMGEGMAERRVPLSANANRAALQVSRTVLDALVDVHEPLVIAHGAALERNGRVHAIVSNASGVGKTTLAFHLLSRGWRIISDDRILVDRSTGHVLPYHRLLTVGSSALPFVPRMFRRALEASPWFYEPDCVDVVYIAVDPALACGSAVWSLGGPLESVLFATRAADGIASVETIDADRIPAEGTQLAAWIGSGAATRLGLLSIGAPTVTADAVEVWAER
ncbi:MAG: hypothetical protein ACLPYS_02965 [Vulcanimicrobiaceae bacterium]